MMYPELGRRKIFNFWAEAMDIPEGKQLSQQKKSASRGNKHADRTAITRQKLLQAAEEVFARDGFEAARLESIAAEAGYTRGALYANFNNKEDLFIALLAEEVERRMTRARLASVLVKQSPNPLKTLRQNYIRSFKDRKWNILFLEYKLFVLRHPEFDQKISEMQARAFATIKAVLEEIYSDLGVQLIVPTLAATTALAALGNTLGLDLQIGKAITEPEADTTLGLLFDALISSH
jgi:AcrR family transcriptional regulator